MNPQGGALITAHDRTDENNKSRTGTKGRTTNMTNDIYNPETWTEQDRAFLDTARRLTPAEMDFLLEVMNAVDEDPQKSEARADFAEQHASQYKLRTEDGRNAFLQALKAV